MCVLNYFLQHHDPFRRIGQRLIQLVRDTDMHTTCPMPEVDMLLPHVGREHTVAQRVGCVWNYQRRHVVVHRGHGGVIADM